MKSKRLILTFVFALALMLALAISSYAATITLYSGADATTSATTHNGSLTLTGNTEENETVTVYFTDDGRAWKAGETVSFTEDTNLYTIECTKISTAAEWNNATGGNYILVSHLDFHMETPKADGSGGQGSGTRTNSGGPMDLTQGSTTRVFFNGYTVGSGNQIAFKGTDVSIYLLGNGIFNSYWGGTPMHLTFTQNANSTVVVGKGIVAQSDWTNKVPFINVNNFNADAKLDFHFYGSYTKGQLIGQNTNAGQGAYNVYLHDGCTLNFPSSNDGGRLVATATAPTANFIFEGGTFTFTRENLFVDNADLSNVNIKITGGTFTFSYESTMKLFVEGIDSEYKANYTSDLAFGIICKECSFIKTLGDDFNGLTNDFTVNSYCPKCKTVGEPMTVEKVFTAKGYSLNSDGTAINGGYGVNLKSLALYEEIMGDVKYGIVIANAESFDGKSFFDENNNVNSDKAIKVEINGQYSNFDCSIKFGTTSNSTLKLVITAYVIDESGTSFIQYDSGETVESSDIADGIFKSVTLDMIVASQPAKTKEELV